MSEESFKRADFVVFNDDPFAVFQITDSTFESVGGGDVIWTYSVIYIGGECTRIYKRPTAFHGEIAPAAPMLVIAAASQG